MGATSQFVSNMNEFIIIPLIGLLISLATLIFVWGLVEFIHGSGSNPAARETGKKHMMWGIIGLFIMVFAKAIISLFINSFGIDTAPIDNALL
ncbi:TPA: hypothetical protein DCZ46_03985 [Candidatus Campbellbacteria bacterium]|uniref:Uncharacterized protein n=1 Tax=Candidatus Campbellbacteria bacterium RIFCSPLOWO2_01_FULL_34_15 TaxID=1797579 RepID=A0A1F5EMF1_9BACT|nr:MAG: seg [Candidatus Campbellbacteria bacterium GW2011_OD1_34_28]KKP74995.1 MAG: hypothetical protein UR74_C0002G0261 [Candidatus Campbellbacteria bacterium GW2011_GWD2_35_24]KKP75881.1 MAG: hypothetical protein UR75_C0002G0262 [Candidatus Campbellbacteria bacterium GW2011_GWC2_35_28]KKP76871.1 MAG: hypothetical protein UR76_C0002G0072 [Candidatus Campbellbacteria bacterium GW2011_GWC1_35_31]KKP78797.1 MAG: hypothetical protein UR79_C0002G0072 [Candidatus Campbellbacteria bacterium GW2011_GW